MPLLGRYGPPNFPQSTALCRPLSGTTQQLAAEASGVAIVPGHLSPREPITEFNGVLGTRDDNPRLPLHLLIRKSIVRPELQGGR